jgi:methyltransferase (TIGR00027 family)
MWVAALRGLAEYDDPAIVSDPLAAELLPFGYRTLVRAAERSPRASRAIMRSVARASGNLSRHMAMRTRAIDDVVSSEALAGSEQLVLLGAGFDARAYRLEALAGVTVFEVDHPDTQRGKREAIRFHTPLAREIRYAPIDFAKDTLDDALARAGHDATQRTTFVWEGVTMYLTSDAIDATLSSIARHAAKGSVLAATYHDPAMGWESLPLTLFVRAVGEPFVTRMTPANVRARVERVGFVVESDEGSDDWSERYLHERGYRDGERLVVARRR